MNRDIHFHKMTKLRKYRAEMVKKTYLIVGIYCFRRPEKKMGN